MGELLALPCEFTADDPNQATKRCRLCNEVKDIQNFSILYTRTDNGHPYRRNECKPCRKLVAKRPDQIAKSVARNRVYGLTDKAKANKLNAQCLKNYGITLDAAKAMLIAQSGRCANIACAKPIEFHHPDRKSKAVIDHCHKNGHARGILCDMCNKTAGMTGDDIVKLRGLVDYLERTAR